MKKNKGFIFVFIAIAVAAAITTAVVVEVVETVQQSTSQPSGSSSSSSSSSGSTCSPPQDCKYPLKTCKYCDNDLRCVSQQECVKECPPPCTDQICRNAAKKTTYNKCVAGKCVSVTEQYDIHELRDECSPVGSSCDPGCLFSECTQSIIVNHEMSETDVSPIAGYAYVCRPSVYAKSDECISSSDCQQKYGGSSPSSSKFCSVTATASPKNLSEDQDQVTISATNLKNTSLDKCKVSGYSLPHTFTQTVSSKTYTVSCTGNSGYKNCSSSIKVTKEGGIENGDNGDNGYDEIPRCRINKFELPERAWVDIETIAKWSTNDICTTAEIKCISDNCIEAEEQIETLSGSVNPGFGQSKNFTIKTPGTYRYELVACTGPIPADPHNDEDCDVYEDVLGTGDPFIEIEALHLPWWQEIIPSNLQGLLRGLLGDR
ncbi:MAG: hypothetical protein PHT66_02390 [Candidatus Pacebacteria bacterium]|jgi:hypothetical protein|nr:hypothetical protein [Candidatus Paceibacterota bacterium]